MRSKKLYTENINDVVSKKKTSMGIFLKNKNCYFRHTVKFP